jgi:hypothetical protein
MSSRTLARSVSEDFFVIPQETETTGADRNRDRELQQIRDALRGLRFGTVNVIVQDGVVVQIDRTEKRRLRRVEST